MNAQSVFSQSELALASYATLTTADLITQKDALKANNGMSGPQADVFATRYSVVTQYTDTLAEGGMGTSFSATVFKDAAGNVTLAIRGTADFPGGYVPQSEQLGWIPSALGSLDSFTRRMKPAPEQSRYLLAQC